MSSNSWKKLGGFLIGFTLAVVVPLAMVFSAGQGTVDIPLKTSINEIVHDVRSSTVLIHCSGEAPFGSGMTIKAPDASYVLTAAHVVSPFRYTEYEATEPVTKFKPLTVVRYLYKGGKQIGRAGVTAHVIRYSDAEAGEDLALLQLEDKSFATHSVKFYRYDRSAPVGTEVYHCGCLKMKGYMITLTSGIISAHDREVEGVDVLFDQTDAIVYPGSSGGGLFDKKTGECVGMVARSAAVGLSIFVPSYRIVKWANDNKLDFIIDNKVVSNLDDSLVELVPPPEEECPKEMPHFDDSPKQTAKLP